MVQAFYAAYKEHPENKQLRVTLQRGLTGVTVLDPRTPPCIIRHLKDLPRAWLAKGRCDQRQMFCHDCHSHFQVTAIFQLWSQRQANNAD
eukprot:11602384-Alexandrium_andersonii.AAC.1